MKRKNKIIWGISSLVFLVIIISTGAGLYMLDYALRPDNQEKDFRATDLQGSWKYMLTEYPHISQWVDSLQQTKALKDTFIITDDHIRLHAFYASSPDSTSRTAVIVHGYTDNAIRMMMIGYMYNHDLRYNILLPDLRYAGWSEGSHIQMGWNDRTDVLRWMDIANNIFGGNTQMVIHGISMGAATTMMVSGEKQKEYVKCFVEDCGYTSVKEQFAKELKEQFGLPSFPILNIASYLCQLKYGWNFDIASAENQVRKCKLPMLFIHGDADDYVPTWMVHKVYTAKPAPKELWVVPNATHAMSYRDNKTEYTNRVKDFTTKYISE